MLDIDGKFTYSKTIAVKMDERKGLQIYHNTVNYTGNIVGENLLDISIRDIAGKLIVKKKMQGAESTTIDVSK